VVILITVHLGVLLVFSKGEEEEEKLKEN